jgi:hypothetical protein
MPLTATLLKPRSHRNQGHVLRSNHLVCQGIEKSNWSSEFFCSAISCYPNLVNASAIDGFGLDRSKFSCDQVRFDPLRGPAPNH